MSNKIILALVLTLLLTTIGSAASYNVAANFADVNSAIENAIDGDEIIVADGTITLTIDVYNHQQQFNTNGKAITVKSANGPSNCTIDCHGVTRAFLCENFEDVTTVIDGFTIKDGSADYGAAIECYGSSPTIKNCVIEGGQAYYGGAIDIFFGSPVIQDCVIRNNTADSDGSAIECSGGESMPVIQNCLFYGNTATNRYAALDFYDNCSAEITNCTIVNNTGIDSFGGVYSTDSDVTIRNSILWNNGISTSGIITATYCCIENGHSGTGNISSNPIFKTGRYGDYYLSQVSAGQYYTSSCVNAGDSNAVNIFGTGAYTTNTYDIDDTTKVDIGYHYYNPNLQETCTLTTYPEPSAVYGSVDPCYPTGQTFPKYSEKSISAYPAGTYQLTEWHYGDTAGFPGTYNVFSGLSEFTITLDADKTVVPVFNTVPMYKLTAYVVDGNGTVSVSPNNYPDEYDPDSYYIQQGTTATITVATQTGYIVKNWYIYKTNDPNHSVIKAATSNTCVIDMNDNITVEAQLQYQEYELRTRVDGGNGTILPKRTKYPAGTTVNLSATPYTGYRVHAWGGDAIIKPNWNARTNTVLMNAIKDVNVTFELDTSKVIFVGAGGDIQGAIDDANNGDTVKLSPGTYVGTGLMVSGNKAITILGDPENPENYVIDCSGEGSIGIYVSSMSPCTINGITIKNIDTFTGDGTNARGPDQAGVNGFDHFYGAISLVNANHQVLNCRISNVTLSAGDGGAGADGNTAVWDGSYGGDGGWAMGGGIVIWDSSPLIKGTIIEDCTVIGGNGGNGGNGRTAEAPDSNLGEGGYGGLPGAAYGGGIACWKNSSPIFEDCIIRRCQAIGGHGGNGGNGGRTMMGGYGGLAKDAGAWHKNNKIDPNGWGGSRIGINWPNNIFATFDPVTFATDANSIDISDYSTQGGGIYVGRDCNVKFIGCTLNDNTAEGCISGLGGLYNVTGAQIQPRKNYHMPSYGSAVFCDANSITKFTRCEVYNDEIVVTNDGEDIVSENDDCGGGSLGSRNTLWKDVNDCNIYTNFAPYGAGIYDVNSNDTHINDCNIYSNNSYSGGGVMTIDCYGHIHNSIIRNNTAGTQLEPNLTDYALFGSGGGVYAFSSCLDINDSIITDNAANSTGGGICFAGDYAVTPTIMNCLIKNNRAGVSGGGIAAIEYADLTIQNCTIYNNAVTGAEGSGGGIFASYAAKVIVKNNIIWNNKGIAGSQIGLSKGGSSTYFYAYMKALYNDIDLRANAALDFANSTSSSPSITISKLIDAETIYNEINTSGTAKVIITLADVDFDTDWSSSASISMTQNAIAYRQTKVLSSMEAGEFTLTNQYVNVAALGGKVTASGLTSLLNNSLVAHIEPVRICYPALAQAIPMGNALATRSQYNGQNCAIAIVDTGIDYTHSRLGGGSFPNAKTIGGFDFGDNDADPMPVEGYTYTDGYGIGAHGTNCAGIAAGNLGTVGDYIGGVAYGAKLYALKVTLNTDLYQGFPNTATYAAWDWCLTHKDDNSSYPIRVISNSWGSRVAAFDNEEDADNYSPSFATLAKNIVDAGITILAASGNEGRTDSIAWPSAMSNVISVGALYDTTGQVTDYSNSADNLDIFAPADPVYTTDLVGSAGYDGDYYPYFNGTSSACPFIAGCVAALQSAALDYLGAPLTPAQIETILKATGTSVTDTKVAVTKPMVNLLSAITLLSSSSPIYTDDAGNTLVGIAKDASNNWTVQGSTNISADPNFVLGFYLSSIDAGQDITSVCVNAGSTYATVLNLDTYTTRTDGVKDMGYVDMGYHYGEGLSVYNLVIDVNTSAADGTTDPLPGLYKKYSGEVVTITAVPDVNSRVAAWIIDGTSIPSNVKKYTITMDKSHTVTVVFEEYVTRSIVVPDQYKTIQEALDVAESGDIIYIYPKSDGTPHYIEDPCGLDFGGKALTIRSRYPDDKNIVAETIIDCNNRGRAFIFRNNEDACSVIEGLTITNGLASGTIATGTRIVLDPEDANIYQLDGNDGNGNGYGGAIYVGVGASPTIRKCVFTNCQVTGGQGSDGGRGYDLPSDSTLERGGFGGDGGNGSGNGYGGVIFCAAKSAPAVLDCKFNDNAAHGGIGGDGGDGGNGASGKTAGNGGDGGDGYGNGFGGVIYCSAKSSPKILGCSFGENLGGMGVGGTYGLQGWGPTPTDPPYPYDGYAGSSSGTGYGGAIYYEKGSNADINDCQILNGDTVATTGDTLGSGGGAIYFEPACANSVILNSTLAGNKASAGLGGAIILNANNKLVLNNCYIGGNSANTDGGAIAVGSKNDANLCELVFSDCVFTSNTASALGGSIYAKNSDANFVECFVNRNTAHSGGGLYIVSESSLRFIGGTINDNNAVGSDAQGGGAMIMHLPAEFINCQITGNSSNYAGGGIMLNGPETAISQIINCLFAKNRAAVRGGAIVTSLDSSPTIKSCTFSENETDVGGKGGGIFCTFRSSPKIKYCIFDKNKRIAIYENSTDCKPVISYNLFNNNYHGDYYNYTIDRLFSIIQPAIDRSTELSELNAHTAGNNIADLSVNSNEIEIFRAGSLGDYYLRQKTADYNDTACLAINAGDVDAMAVTVFDGKTMADYTTRTDSYLPDATSDTYDIGKLDLGFHYKDANEAAQLYLTTEVAGGKGTISPASGYVYRGTTVQLTAAPTTGWRVKQWLGTDDDSTTNTTNYVVMMSDRTVSVAFEQPRNLYLPAGYATLQEAINDSRDGDKIIISPGTYQYFDINYDNLFGVAINGKSITITGSNPDDPCVVAATIFKGNRFVISNVDSSMILDGITIQGSHWYGGDALCPTTPISPDGINGGSLLGGAMEINNASPTIRNVRFVDCSAGGGDGTNNCSTGGDGGWAGYGYGGAVGIDSGSSPVFKNCSFTGCYAYGGDGGDGDTSNDTPGHGGNWGDPNGSRYQTWDYADDMGGPGSYAPYWYYTGQGGAIYCSADTHPVFKDCVFSNNFVVGGTCGISCPDVEAWPNHHYIIDSFGGAVYMATGSQADFTDCNFVNNLGDTRNQIGDVNNVAWLYKEANWALSDNVVSYGGAIYAESTDSIPTVKDCTFNSNIACAGGALNVEDSIFHISNSNFFGNTAMLGGSMLFIGSDTILSSCDFYGNTAVAPAGQGGVVYSAAGAPKFYDCRMLYNSASSSGGAGYFSGELEPIMHNCLITHNTAATYGGGLSANFDVQLHMSSCTVAHNQATGSTSFGGGLNCAYNANTTVINSIFWENEANTGRQIAIGNSYSAADKQPAEVTVTYSDIQSGGAGIFCDQTNGCLLYGFTEPSTNLYGTSLSSPQFISSLWVTTPWNDYFLAAPDINEGSATMQTTDNMCIDSGSGTAISWNMYKHTTRTDRKIDVPDSNIDMGYHYIIPATITGDFDFDGDVDIVDCNGFMQYWMYEDCTFPYYCNGRDFTEDGEVDFEDYAIFADYYQETEKIPPQPNSMTWAILPKSAGLTSITMTATTATDNSSKVIEYYFECLSVKDHNSGWITSSTYTDTGLTTGDTYGYQVKARDGRGNETGWSLPHYTRAGSDSTAPTPDPMTWLIVPTLIDSNSVGMSATIATDISGVEYSFEETTGHNGGTNSGWISVNTYIDYGLEPNTVYTYKVQARDKSDNYNETGFSAERSIKTPASGGDVNDVNDTNDISNIIPLWTTEPYATSGNPWYYHIMDATAATDAVAYYFDCCEGGGTDSGWITSTHYEAGPFGSVTNSSYRYKYKNAAGKESGWSPIVSTFSGW
ncbi:MAG: S8 family serine peptidase [Planctomycetaceae bacterium]|nr:S8 family serine peptidase [Planctomycetaceae bacterium]